jgi:FtsH-binding integral membrane protein
VQRAKQESKSTFMQRVLLEVRAYLLTAMSAITLLLFAQIIYVCFNVSRPYVIAFGMTLILCVLLFIGPRLSGFVIRGRE